MCQIRWSLLTARFCGLGGCRLIRDLADPGSYGRVDIIEYVDITEYSVQKAGSEQVRAMSGRQRDLVFRLVDWGD